MLITLAVVLIILWLLGLISSYTLGGWLHILLVVAIVAIVIQLLTGLAVADRRRHSEIAAPCASLDLADGIESLPG
jgi:hypothetical protein